MALQAIDIDGLEERLLETLEKVRAVDHLAYAVFKTQYNTGLRVGEVIEVERWARVSDYEFSVQLSKGEGVRIIDDSEIEQVMVLAYESQKRLVMQTYSSLNNTLKRNGKPIIFGDLNRRSSTHAFRYRKFKRLAADGMSVNEIAAYMGHVSKMNTFAYVGEMIQSY